MLMPLYGSSEIDNNCTYKRAITYYYLLMFCKTQLQIMQVPASETQQMRTHDIV